MKFKNNIHKTAQDAIKQIFEKKCYECFKGRDEIFGIELDPVGESIIAGFEVRKYGGVGPIEEESSWDVLNQEDMEE